MPWLRILFCFLLITVLVAPCCVYAQGGTSEQVCIKGRRYLDLNIRSLDKYARRLERTQQQLLARLARKERRLARRLKHSDSAAYARLQASSLPSYDSIARLAAAPPDSSSLAARARRSADKAIDTLKAVYGFVQSRAGALSGAAGGVAGAAGLDGYAAKISGLSGRLSYDQYISGLISRKTASLEGIAGGDGALGGIQKEVFYAKSKLREWKSIAEEPSKAEALALEYLEGTKGFNLNNTTAAGGAGDGSAAAMGGGGSVSADELEKMGYQTKRQVMAGLQQKYGSSLGQVGANLGKDMEKWQDGAQGLAGTVKETKQSLQGLRNTARPSFKVNPMRGLPFWKRIEKQYGVNTSRAAVDGDGTERPALLSLSAGVAYRQSPKLKAGVALAADMGLGRSWDAIRLSFGGLGARVFVNWDWQWGIGAYGGYERTYRQSPFKAGGEVKGPEGSVHSRDGYSESVLLGLTKGYKVNSRWNGQVQLLYDVWWQDKALRSPIILRFITTSK